jgi:chromosome partitioning protein
MASSPALDDMHGKLESRYKIYKLRDALAELQEPATTRSGSTRRRR